MSVKYPENLQEAIVYAEDHHAKTGQVIETVPNPDKGIFFDLMNRTVSRLTWDEEENIITVVSCADSGRELARKIVLSKELMDKVRHEKKEIDRKEQ